MYHSSEQSTKVGDAKPFIQVVDIASHSDKKHRELEDLRTKSDRLTHLLEVMPAGVIVLDNKGRVTQANHQAVDLLGEPLE
jgi:two-component system sensor histidine kinase FlrB